MSYVYEQNGFPVCYRNKQEDFRNNWSSCFSDNTKKATKFGLEVLLVLYLDDMFIDNLKLNSMAFLQKSFWTQKEFTTWSFWRNVSARAKQTRSKILLIGKKMWELKVCIRSFACQNCNRWQQQMSWKSCFLCSIISLF